MRRLLTLLFTLPLLFCPEIKASPPRDSDSPAKVLRTAGPEQQVALQEMRYKDACLTGNVKYFEDTIANGYVSTSSGGVVSDRAQLIGNWKTGALKFESVDVRELKIRSYRNVAVVNGRSTIKAKLKDQDVSGTYQYTRVWLKQGGRWQLIASQETAVPAEGK